MGKCPVVPPAGGSGGGVVVGTYDGDGAETREIVLGFAPAFVLVFLNGNDNIQIYKTPTASKISASRDNYDSDRGGYNGTYTATAAGFMVGTQDKCKSAGYSSNGSEENYSYIAFR